jgi:hypothetical protein
LLSGVTQNAMSVTLLIYAGALLSSQERGKVPQARHVVDQQVQQNRS